MLIDTSDLRRAQFDRLRYEIFQNLFLRSMNTGFLRLAVATALTVYGIETSPSKLRPLPLTTTLQQHLPFTVLKLEELH